MVGTGRADGREGARVSILGEMRLALGEDFAPAAAISRGWNSVALSSVV